MKTITEPELRKILADHREWVESGGLKGQRADLSESVLSPHASILRVANLNRANLNGAKYDPTPIFERERKEREEWEKEHAEEAQ